MKKKKKRDKQSTSLEVSITKKIHKTRYSILEDLQLINNI